MSYEKKGVKIVVIGGVAGGASAAARIRRLDERAEILMLEKGEHTSFSNCSLPYYLSGVVQDSEDLIMMEPEDFRSRYNIDVRVLSQVTAINRAKKTVSVKNLLSGEEYEETYDKLILSPGADPIVPPNIAGTGRDNVFTVRNVTDIRALKARIDMPDVKNVAVIGGGFIGIEVAENLRLAGKNVSIIELADQILAPFDYDMVQMLHKELDDNGVALYLNAGVTAIEDGFVKADRNGKTVSVPADVAVLAIGVTPRTDLAAAAGLEIGKSRGISVNHNYQTSDPDIYAVGDAIEVFNAQTRGAGRLALAGPAQMQARAAADHICGIDDVNRGFIPSLCLKVFGQNAAATGLSEKAAERAGYSCDSVLLFPSDKVGIMPNSNYMAFKLIFEVPTGVVLGAQAVGRGDVVGRVNVVAAMISMHCVLEDLKNAGLCYSPVYGTAKDPVNLAALVALNILNGRFRQVHVDKVRELVESGAYIIDVREPGERKNGYLNGSHNIPLSQLHERMGEVPRDVPVYLHCRSSQRSYYAVCALQNNGFTNVVNISGSYLGISYYEYFDDKTKGRTPIMTGYNFN